MRWVVLFGLIVVAVLFFAHRLIAARPIDATISFGSVPHPAASRSGCTRCHELAVSFGEVQYPTAPFQAQLAGLHVGIAHMTSPAPGFRMHHALAEKLAAALNATPELLQPDSYRAISTLLRQGKIDVAFVCSGTYAAAPDAMDILAAPLIDGKMEYCALVIVPANSPCRTFADLRGKSFLYVEEESNTGRWYPCRRARELAGDGGSFFGSTRLTGAHDLSVLAVASNLADGAAISSTVYNQMLAREPALKDRIRILERSAPFPSPPVVVRKSMPLDVRQRLLQVLVTLQDTEDGRGILRGLSVDKFVAARNEQYAHIEPCVHDR